MKNEKQKKNCTEKIFTENHIIIRFVQIRYNDTHVEAVEVHPP